MKLTNNDHRHRIKAYIDEGEKVVTTHKFPYFEKNTHKTRSIISIVL